MPLKKSNPKVKKFKVFLHQTSLCNVKLPGMFSFTFNSIGTHWQIDTDSPPSEVEIKSFLEVFESKYSRFRPNSIINKISREPRIYQIESQIKPLLDLYVKIEKITNGLVTPLIGQALVQSGYDPHYSLTPKTLTPVPRFSEIFDYNFPSLNVKMPFQLDFGGFGKGFAIDLVAKILVKTCDEFTIDAGQDLYIKSNTKKRIGLEHPTDKSKVIGVAEISLGSLCGSAGNRRQWGEFHHIINPKTLKSQNEILATWAYSDTALIADAMTTCLFFVSPEIMLKHFDFEYLILYPDFSTNKSTNFPAEIFLN